MRKKSEEVAQLRKLQRVTLFSLTRDRRKAVGEVARLILTLEKPQNSATTRKMPSKPSKSLLTPAPVRVDKVSFTSKTERIPYFSHSCSQSILRMAENASDLLLSERTLVRFKPLAVGKGKEKTFSSVFSSCNSSILTQSITNLAGIRKMYASASPRRVKVRTERAVGD